jgi:hypothetical protein
MSDTYFIGLEFRSTFVVQDVASALQVSYDNGAAGSFTILRTQVGYFVIFERSAIEDAEYVSARMSAAPSLSLEHHAQRQLHDELKDGAIGAEAVDVLEGLSLGAAQCFDFSTGAIESLIGDLEFD